MTKATTTRRAGKAARAQATITAQTEALGVRLPTAEEVEQQAIAAQAEEAANLAREAEELALEAVANAGYTGPMLKLRERLKAGKYVKAANGQPCCSDATATVLGAFEPQQVIAICIEALGCGRGA